MKNPSYSRHSCFAIDEDKKDFLRVFLQRTCWWRFFNRFTDYRFFLVLRDTFFRFFLPELFFLVKNFFSFFM